MARYRILIDENLSVTLADLARKAGHESQHVNHLGLRTKSDAALMDRIVRDGWTLVTNNWREFLARYQAKAPLHAGLVLLLSVAGLSQQQLAFKRALLALGDENVDLVNTALFVELIGQVMTARLEPWPV